MIFVDYSNGTSGEFVLTCLHLMQDPTHRAIVNQSGSAHDNRRFEFETSFNMHEQEEFILKHDDNIFEQQYNDFLDRAIARRLDENGKELDEPIILKAHTTIYQQDLINKGNTVIAITSNNEAMFNQIATNICWKVMVHEFNSYGKQELYNILIDEGITPTGTLFDLTEDQYYTVIKNIQEGVTKQATIVNTAIKDINSDKFFTINFSDLQSNKEKVLNTLELASGFKVNNKVHDFYNRYIEAQSTPEEIHNKWMNINKYNWTLLQKGITL